MSEQQTSDSSPHEPLPDFVRRRQLPVVTLDHNPYSATSKLKIGTLTLPRRTRTTHGPWRRCSHYTGHGLSGCWSQAATF